MLELRDRHRRRYAVVEAVCTVVVVVVALVARQPGWGWVVVSPGLVVIYSLIVYQRVRDDPTAFPPSVPIERRGAVRRTVLAGEPTRSEDAPLVQHYALFILAKRPESARAIGAIAAGSALVFALLTYAEIKEDNAVGVTVLGVVGSGFLIAVLLSERRQRRARSAAAVAKTNAAAMLVRTVQPPESGGAGRAKGPEPG